MSWLNKDREESVLTLSSFRSLHLDEHTIDSERAGNVPRINACILSFKSNDSLWGLRLDDLCQKHTDQR